MYHDGHDDRWSSDRHDDTADFSLVRCWSVNKQHQTALFLQALGKRYLGNCWGKRNLKQFMKQARPAAELWQW